MRFHLVACDYDGTLAHDGRLADSTFEALRRVRAGGRRLVLVSGRQKDDLASCFEDSGPFFELFDLLVLENGGVLYDPRKRESTRLGPPPPAGLVEALAERGVGPIARGEVVVATWRPHETTCLEVIRERGLEIQVIFNKGAVMLLPSGCNKASGLAAALSALGLSPHNVVAVGDAENDHALISSVACGVAVANAVPALKEHADIVTHADHGAGVEELLEALEEDDLQAWMASAQHPQLCLGSSTAPSGTPGPVTLGPYEDPVLIAGSSGGGKSTLATTLVERLRTEGFQTCLFDPEGEHGVFDDVAEVGSPDVPPKPTDVRDLLKHPGQHVSVNLLAVPLADRPAMFAEIFGQLLLMRHDLGRPHAIIIDEAHHCLPTNGETVVWPEPAAAHGLVLVSVHPERLPPRVLQSVATTFVVGETPQDAFNAIAGVMEVPAPQVGAEQLPHGQAYCWRRGQAPLPFKVDRSRYEHQRHTRKYAEGDLGDKSFVFRGPHGALNLRANNLATFLELGEGVDEDTWLFHLQRGDFSRWLAEVIKDDDLAREAETLASEAPSRNGNGKGNGHGKERGKEKKKGHRQEGTKAKDHDEQAHGHEKAHAEGRPIGDLRKSLRHAIESRYVAMR